jgi:hypothetical protein
VREMMYNGRQIIVENCTTKQSVVVIQIHVSVTCLIHVGRLSHEDRKTSSFRVWLFVAV